MVGIKDERSARLEIHKRVAWRAKAEGKMRIYEMALRAIAKLTLEVEGEK